MKNLLKYSIVVLLGAWFLTPGYLDVAPEINGELTENDQTFFSDQGANPLNTPSHQPFCNENKEQEQEPADETDSKEDVEDDWNHSSTDSYFSDISSGAVATNSALNLIVRIQNRSTVSLFVLYHSWKIFLS